LFKIKLKTDSDEINATDFFELAFGEPNCSEELIETDKWEINETVICGCIDFFKKINPITFRTAQFLILSRTNGLIRINIVTTTMSQYSLFV
jgi:hypothetical protein